MYVSHWEIRLRVGKPVAHQRSGVENRGGNPFLLGPEVLTKSRRQASSNPTDTIHLSLGAVKTKQH